MNLLNTNKRKSPRISVGTSACLHHGSSLLCGALTVNISAGGALLISPAFLPANEPIGIDFHFRTTDKYKDLRGEIRRSVPIYQGRQQLLAIQFANDHYDLSEAAEVEAKLNKYESTRRVE